MKKPAPKLTADQRKRVKSMIEDEGCTRAEALAWVLHFEPAPISTRSIVAAASKRVAACGRAITAALRFARDIMPGNAVVGGDEDGCPECWESTWDEFRASNAEDFGTLVAVARLRVGESVDTDSGQSMLTITRRA